MAGELVPLVLLPRFSTFAGDSVFYTVGMDVTEFQNAILNCWRGKIPAGCTFGFTFQESTDQDNWTTCSTTSTGWDPGQDTEAQVTAPLKKRWFRVKVELTGADPQATCWIVGFLENRLA